MKNFIITASEIAIEVVAFALLTCTLIVVITLWHVLHWGF